MVIKPIETVYKGYRFRSRLEARWAVFFDTLDIVYQYESEGLDLGALGWYLPDFYIPHLHTLIEIKPLRLGESSEDWPYHPMFEVPSPPEYTKRLPAVVLKYEWMPLDEWPRHARVLLNYWNKEYACPIRPRFVLIKGQPWLSDPYEAGDGYCGFIHGDQHYVWCECAICGCIGIEFEGRSGRLPCGCHGSNDRAHNRDTPRLRTAFTAARQARFERR